MTISWLSYHGGESQQTDADGSSVLGALAGFVGWAPVTTPKKTGIGAWRVNANGTHIAPEEMRACQFSTSNIGAWSTWAVLSGTPSNAFCLAGAGGDDLALECGTDGKIRLVYIPASQVWADRIPLTGWSSAALATDDATFKHIFWWHDPLSLGTYLHPWVGLLIDGVEQWAVDANRGIAMFVDPVHSYDNVNSGIYVTLDDIVGLHSGSAADAPHLVPWPVVEVRASLPKSDVVAQWFATGGGAGTYAMWDESTFHDSDTTYNVSALLSKTQTSGMQTAADLSISDRTILLGLVGARAPVSHMYLRCEISGTKFGAYLTGQYFNNMNINDPGTIAYIVDLKNLARSSGVWSVADIGGWHGAVTAASNHDKALRVTKLQVHWPVYKDTVQATKRPESILSRSQAYVL